MEANASNERGFARGYSVHYRANKNLAREEVCSLVKEAVKNVRAGGFSDDENVISFNGVDYRGGDPIAIGLKMGVRPEIVLPYGSFRKYFFSDRRYYPVELLVASCNRTVVDEQVNSFLKGIIGLTDKTKPKISEIERLQKNTKGFLDKHFGRSGEHYLISDSELVMQIANSDGLENTILIGMRTVEVQKRALAV